MSVTDAAVPSQGVVLSAYQMKPTTTDNEYMSLDMKPTTTDIDYSYPAMQSECEASNAI